MYKLLKKSPHLIIMLLGIFFPICSLSGYATQFDNQIIEKLDITIATESPESSEFIIRTIRSRLKTREGNIFSQTDFDSDLKMLVQDYDRIEPHVESIQDKIFVTLKIWPNPVIRSICWEGNERINRSKLQSELGISRGSVFSRQKFNSAFNQVKGYYVKQGFFEAQLDYDACFDEFTNEVDITIRVDEGRAGKIKNICFTNFTKCEQNDLLDMMVTKKYNFFLSWITGEGTYNEDMIQHDKLIVLNYLQNLGYADAKVDLTVCEAPQKDRINLYFKATKGQCYRFGDITLNGNQIYSDEQLRKRLTICQGAPFSPDQIHDNMRILTNYYGKCGYIEAIVNYEPKLREDSYIYDVDITIDEGDQYFVGMVKVLGNCSTQTKVILHETLLIPGEVFNLEKLQWTERRLVNIGYFKHVNVYAVKSEGDSILPHNYRDVIIEVEETNTGHMGAFCGFSTVENIFGGINLTERNFNYKGLGCFWRDGMRALRGGGEYAHITFSLGRKSSSYILSWTKPYFLDTPWSVGFDIDRTNNEYISDDYEIKAYGLTLHATHECNAFLRVGTHYRLRKTEINVSSDAGEKLKEEAGNAGLTSALGLSWNYDSTDHPLIPTCGLKSRVEGEIAGLGGDHAFLSVGYLNSYYFDVCGKGVIKVRGDFRFIQPLGKTNFKDLPIDERLFLGGDNTLRGYRSYRIGPKFDDDDENPRGGISMQIYSLEYSKPIFSRFDAFVFADAGSLTKRKWCFGKMYYSAGYGCRFQVFENGPPLTVGMGYPLNPNDSNDVKRFFITVGGKF
ncbi:MAG: Outer membrane protein assembly factor BamA [Chlamydiae bacterium]|nr:Outer membrane protein assembly factor BamA [Chlamydiota bacterium]